MFGSQYSLYIHISFKIKLDLINIVLRNQHRLEKYIHIFILTNFHSFEKCKLLLDLFKYEPLLYNLLLGSNFLVPNMLKSYLECCWNYHKDHRLDIACEEWALKEIYVYIFIKYWKYLKTKFTQNKKCGFSFNST